MERWVNWSGYLTSGRLRGLDGLALIPGAELSDISSSNGLARNEGDESTGLALVQVIK